MKIVQNLIKNQPTEETQKLLIPLAIFIQVGCLITNKLFLLLQLTRHIYNAYSVSYYPVTGMPSLLAEPLNVLSGINLRQSILI